MTAVRLHMVPPGVHRDERRPVVVSAEGLTAKMIREGYWQRRSFGYDPRVARALTVTSFMGLADRIKVGP